MKIPISLYGFRIITLFSLVWVPSSDASREYSKKLAKQFIKLAKPALTSKYVLGSAAILAATCVGRKLYNTRRLEKEWEEDQRALNMSSDEDSSQYEKNNEMSQEEIQRFGVKMAQRAVDLVNAKKMIADILPPLENMGLEEYLNTYEIEFTPSLELHFGLEKIWSREASEGGERPFNKIWPKIHRHIKLNVRKKPEKTFGERLKNLPLAKKLFGITGELFPNGFDNSRSYASRDILREGSKESIEISESFPPLFFKYSDNLQEIPYGRDLYFLKDSLKNLNNEEIFAKSSYKGILEKERQLINLTFSLHILSLHIFFIKIDDYLAWSKEHKKMQKNFIRSLSNSWFCWRSLTLDMEILCDLYDILKKEEAYIEGAFRDKNDPGYKEAQGILKEKRQNLCLRLQDFFLEDRYKGPESIIHDANQNGEKVQISKESGEFIRKWKDFKAKNILPKSYIVHHFIDETQKKATLREFYKKNPDMRDYSPEEALLFLGASEGNARKNAIHYTRRQVPGLENSLFVRGILTTKIQATGRCSGMKGMPKKTFDIFRRSKQTSNIEEMWSRSRGESPASQDLVWRSW